MRSAPDPRSRGGLPQKAGFLAGAAVLILVAHAIDVLMARGPNWPALALRAAWAALLFLAAWAMARSSWRAIQVTGTLAAVGTLVLYLALVVQTGGSSSPLHAFAFVLVVVFPVFMGELMRIGLAASALLVVGVAAIRAGERLPVEEQIAAGVAGAAAFAVAWMLGAADRRARRQASELHAEREEALVRLAESERLAALGSLAAEVAHRVNNPLAAARSTAAFLRSSPGEEEGVEDAWGDLVSSLDRIAEQVRRLGPESARPATRGEAPPS